MNTRAPLKPCRKPGCNKLSRNTYCGDHEKHRAAVVKKQRRDYDKIRGTRTERGYSNVWLRASKAYRAENPLCRHCEKRGKITLTQCTDHIIPHNGDEELFWDRNNWQPLCKTCHGIKTAAEDGAYGNVKK